MSMRAVGLPPLDATWYIWSRQTEKAIFPDALQLAPMIFPVPGISQIAVGRPPSAETFQSLRLSPNTISRESGDQLIGPASAISATARGASWSSSRTHTWLFEAYANRAPSGESRGAIGQSTTMSFAIRSNF